MIIIIVFRTSAEKKLLTNAVLRIGSRAVNIGVHYD